MKAPSDTPSLLWYSTVYLEARPVVVCGGHEATPFRTILTRTDVERKVSFLASLKSSAVIEQRRWLLQYRMCYKRVPTKLSSV